LHKKLSRAATAAAPTTTSADATTSAVAAITARSAAATEASEVPARYESGWQRRKYHGGPIALARRTSSSAATSATAVAPLPSGTTATAIASDKCERIGWINLKTCTLSCTANKTSATICALESVAAVSAILVGTR
jgi:hypothetical protein